MFVLLFFVLPIGSVVGGGAIDWTFWMNDREDFLLNAMIGTPPTPVALALIQGTEFDGLRVVTDRDYDNT
ncbi:hypothetical protein M3Y99_00653200 [Aphelenchoides fujianensis]|nr:hypothetical protein M3Y99_00653200 [Aphelenchoides fujianensis]